MLSLLQIKIHLYRFVFIFYEWINPRLKMNKTTTMAKMMIASKITTTTTTKHPKSIHLYACLPIWSIQFYVIASIPLKTKYWIDFNFFGYSFALVPLSLFRSFVRSAFICTLTFECVHRLIICIWCICARVFSVDRSLVQTLSFIE